ncbi:Uncharacterised protein [Yersinia kristensenii]|nr:Uncharacterised protein [Yersinia kristensenii]
MINEIELPKINPLYMLPKKTGFEYIIENSNIISNDCITLKKTVTELSPIYSLILILEFKNANIEKNALTDINNNIYLLILTPDLKLKITRKNNITIMTRSSNFRPNGSTLRIINGSENKKPYINKSLLSIVPTTSSFYRLTF